MKPIRIPRSLCYSLLILLGGLPSFSEILPPERMSDWSNVGVQGGIPDYPVGVNVKDAPYNAAGDGTTNDTAAILAAIAACPDGHAVYLPAGTYLTTGTLLITKPIVLRGAGPEQTHVLHNHFSLGIRLDAGANRAGIEDLHLETVYPYTNGSGTKVLLMGVTNSWVKNIETSGYAYFAVHLESTTHCEVRDSYVYSTYEYVDWETEGGDMGDAYGIVIRGDTFSSYNLVENNVLDWHRHSMIMLVNCDTNVYGYNFSWTNWSGKQSETQCFKLHHPDYDDDTHSRVIRYTLSEGNIFETCDSQNWHYFNTHLRNRVMLGLGVNVRNSAVGNELTKKKFTWANDNILNQTWQEGVFIHGNYITDRSEMQWDPTVDDHTIPNSYYLDSKPAFFGDLDWPCYGGDLMPGNNRRSPAEVRFWSMQFPEVAPTDLDASVDGGDVTLAWTNNSTNEVSFIVCRSTDNENFERIAIVAETTYTDTVSGDGDYFYYVRAMNHLGGVNGDEYGGESDPSNVLMVVVEDPNPENHAPVLAPIGNQSAQVGQPIEITIEATDEDENPLTYSATGAP
ncbi:MAG: glycosyl hydrolase family 28-related protein [Opitutales bacterium]|nr:glycosyl hydrolase family 28-related protein [Opitutales bacterium]